MIIEVFQYTLGNLSPQMSNLKKKREEKMFKEVSLGNFICYIKLQHFS